THAQLAQRLHDGGVTPAAIAYMQEGHPWERAFALVARRAELRSRLVGYNTGTFAPMWLCMYPHPRELARLPLPDRIVTNGPMLRDVLAAAGYPASALVDGPDLRRAYLWDVAPRRKPRDGEARIVVATEIDPARSI